MAVTTFSEIDEGPAAAERLAEERGGRCLTWLDPNLPDSAHHRPYGGA